MINPVNFNKINMQGMQRVQEKAQTADKTVSETGAAELSGYKAGQAIFARNNISFRNLAQPIEVTDKYNKKTEGKDHLDLPNIHVYEYPDTNLQVLVNADENLKSNESNLTSKCTLIIENNNYDNHDFIKEKLVYFILNNKNPDITGANFCLSVDYTNLLNGIKQNNSIISKPEFSENDLINAKMQLKEFLKSSEYVKDKKDLQKLYSEQDLKPDSEILTEAENITKTELEEYYNNYLKNSTAKIFLTVPAEYFNKNKNRILNQLNQGIKTKFIDSKTALSKEPEFIGGAVIISENDNKTTIKIPTKCVNAKDSLIENIAIKTLKTDEKFNKKYLIDTESFSLPLGLKNNSPLRYHLNFCIVKFNNGTNKPADFPDDFKKMYNKNLTPEIEKQKREIKEKLKQTFTGDRLDIIKHLELMSYSEDIFSLYEIIDSIDEKDIKQYYNDLLDVANKQKGEI